MLECQRFDEFLDSGADLPGVAVEFGAGEVGRDSGEEGGYLGMLGGYVGEDGGGEGGGEGADAGYFN